MRGRKDWIKRLIRYTDLKGTSIDRKCGGRDIVMSVLVPARISFDVVFCLVFLFSFFFPNLNIVSKFHIFLLFTIYII